jgi:hypothetical protein
MPGNPRRQITDKAEEQFPVRITVRVPGHGIGTRYNAMSDWLDENCGVNGWAIGPAGTRGIRNDAIAVYLNGPTCAVALWRGGVCPVIRPPREEPARREPSKPHKSPP